MDESGDMCHKTRGPTNKLRTDNLVERVKKEMEEDGSQSIRALAVVAAQTIPRVNDHLVVWRSVRRSQPRDVYRNIGNTMLTLPTYR